MVALASLCVRDTEADLEPELKEKICKIFHKGSFTYDGQRDGVGVVTQKQTKVLINCVSVA